jgi:hypothetical protein
MFAFDEFVISGTSPASASTAVLATEFSVARFSALAVECEVVGATGGTLDIYFQIRGGNAAVSTDWYDYAHLPQLAAGAAASVRAMAFSRSAQQTTITTIGKNTSPVLAANTVVGGTFGATMRILCVAGAGTSAGAALAFHFLGSN